MSLFGAASTGVNPQSGSYLSREERIAMFKNASGRRGYAGRSAGGGGGGGGGSERANVQATSAIVAVNSMTSTIQQLQVSNQESVQQVQVQVEKNRQDIASLFTTLAEGKEAELVEEKTQTRQDRRRIELGLRAGAEKLLEGLGKAVKKTANALGNVAQKTIQPVKGLLDKLFELLGLLGAAWAIDNLPAILNTIDDFTSNIPSVGEALEGAINYLTGTRGVFTILDRMFQPLKNILRRIANKAIDVGAWIARKSGEFIRKIFKKIKTFVTEVFDGLKRKLGDFFSGFRPKPIAPEKPPGTGALDDAARSADDALEGGVKSADEAGDGVKAITGAAEEATEVPWWKKLGDWGKKQFESLSSAAKTGVNWVGDRIGDGKKLFGDLTEKVKGMAPATTSPKEQISWLEKMLSPMANLFGPSGKKLLKGAVGILSKIPGIGMLIDIAINKGLDGMNWTQAIIRGVSSGAAGAVGGAAGAKAGALAGGAIGTIVPGIGNVIGAAIGAVIGGFLGAAAAGAFGDEVGQVAYKQVTGKSATENDVMFDKQMNKAVGFLGDAFGFEVEPEKDIPSEDSPRPRIELTGLETGNEAIDSAVNNVLDFKFEGTNLSSLIDPSTSSTPEGMQLSPDAKSADESTLSISELPPNFIDQSSTPMTRMEEPKGQAQSVPDFDTADPTMNSYRTMAELLFEVA